jgi:hypothetical protein
VDREQAAAAGARCDLFQHPLYWYSTPAILKEWQDLVLEHGFAYGSRGHRAARQAVLQRADRRRTEAPTAEGYNHFTIRELLRPLEQTAMLCGMTYLPPFALFGARTAVEEGRIARTRPIGRLLGACAIGWTCETGAWTSIPPIRLQPQLNCMQRRRRGGRADPWTACCSISSSISAPR